MTTQLTLINGNGKPYTIGLPRLYILGRFNSTAVAHIRENTGLSFIEAGFDAMEAQPETSEQIAALFMTYNFKTQYHNNLSSKNTLYLKSAHHVGFEVDSICVDCAKHNHIALKFEGRLAA